ARAWIPKSAWILSMWLSGPGRTAYHGRRSAMERAMPDTDRKRSISMSSNLNLTPNSSSACSSNSANPSESSAPLSKRSASSAGTGEPRFRSKRPFSLESNRWLSYIRAVPVIGGLQFEQQAVEGPAVYVVTAALASDGFEVELLEDAQ